MVKEKTTSLEYLMPVFCERLDSGQAVRFSPQGTSMLPMIRQGIDSVVISPLALGEPLKRYDLPLYQRANGQYVLHRVVDVEGNGMAEFVELESGRETGSVAGTVTYTCMGDNQFVEEPGLNHDQMIGVVTEFWRGGRRHSVDETGYKIYCRVWYHSRHLRHFWRRAVRKLRRMLG